MIMRKWEQAQLDYIRANCGDFSDEELAKKMTSMYQRPISMHAIRKVRKVYLGIFKKSGRGLSIIDNREK